MKRKVEDDEIREAVVTCDEITEEELNDPDDKTVIKQTYDFIAAIQRYAHSHNAGILDYKIGHVQKKYGVNGGTRRIFTIRFVLPRYGEKKLKLRKSQRTFFPELAPKKEFDPGYDQDFEDDYHEDEDYGYDNYDEY